MLRLVAQEKEKAEQRELGHLSNGDVNDQEQGLG